MTDRLYTTESTKRHQLVIQEAEQMQMEQQEDERKDRILQRRLSQVIISPSPRSIGGQSIGRKKPQEEEPQLLIRQEPLPWSASLMALLAYFVSVPLYLTVLSITKLVFVIGLAKDAPL